MWDLEFFERCVGPQFSTLLGAYSGVPLVTGRLAQVIEGRGKRRIFAICNYIKQRLLYPVHKWAMDVLSRIPTDGTFNQERPLYALREKGHMKVYSFDLSAATDRWPLSVIYTLMECIWGPVMASSIVNSSLGLNTFLVTSPLVKREREIAFQTGQPLGFYGSWSLFALSHHYLVWLAAKKAFGGVSSMFRDYALLGDDIVIANEDVAREYSGLLNKLDVSISMSKSIISSNGTVEFAKRYWTSGLQKDLSPVSVQALLCCRSTVGLCQLAPKYDIRSLNVLARLGGAGYRVRSRLLSTDSRKWARLRAAFRVTHLGHRLPTELWIGRGSPLNPYLRAGLIVYLLRELKPKQIQLFPDELVFDGEREILERTVVHRWMKQWLSWVSWYHKVACDPNISIDQLLDAPICAVSWKRQNFYPNRFKFGLVWKLYDMAAGWTVSTTPKWLLDPNTKVQFDRWILGGYKGTDFIMAPVDLSPTGERK